MNHTVLLLLSGAVAASATGAGSKVTMLPDDGSKVVLYPNGEDGNCNAADEGCSSSVPVGYSYQGISLKGQTVLVTGASSGIGAATVRRFATAGCKLVLVARREQKLKELREEILSVYPSAKVHLLVLDVADLAAIAELPKTLPEEFAEVDILVNNAGLALGTNKVTDNSIADVQRMLTVNVASLMAFTQTFTKGMVARGRGHLINIGSIAGHVAYGGGSVYCATKHAVDAFTTSARHDLMDTPVRVTALSPGAVNTEFSTVRFGGDKGKADATYTGFDPLLAEDIADNILYSATRPLRVQVADMIVLANAQAGPKDVHRGGNH